jgi:magnesium-transporting ATPase (P-type)
MLAFATNPLVVILLLASVVSGILHDVTNAVIIALMVLLSVVLNFVQTYRSQQAAERLREAVVPMATVFREGELDRHPEARPGPRGHHPVGGWRPCASRCPPADLP